MGKHKHQPNIAEADNPSGERLTADKKVARKCQTAARYRQRPEVREKQRLLMAERRATVKARRHQWDPPKKAKPAVQHQGSPVPLLTLSPPGSPERGAGPDDTRRLSRPRSIHSSTRSHDGHSKAPSRATSLTSAEHFETMVLAEMADARAMDSQLALPLETSRFSAPPPTAGMDVDHHVEIPYSH
ncbi:hypothetical protein B0H10DRAFT_2246226 [Mycena sp. CBHHK59/15]|nr:hypothetical protein B0H10DRAFT_2246226 [Mycena sp. CBHHK59/15]